MNAKIMNISLGIGVLCFGLLGCGNKQQDLLCRKWKTVSLSNPGMDMEVARMKAYIDTLGAQDPELARSLNLDSLKESMRLDLEHSLQEQQIALQNTLMEFKFNGVAYTTSIEGQDSAMYTLEGNEIKLDEAKLKGHGETMTFTILKLDKDTLRVKLVDYGDTSIASMVPAE